MAEVMVPRALFQQILDAIAALRPLPRFDVERRRCYWPRRLSAGELHPDVPLQGHIFGQTAIND
jgi:hypothetical protein